jgi:hypothetical protein
MMQQAAGLDMWGALNGGAGAGMTATASQIDLNKLTPEQQQSLMAGGGLEVSWARLRLAGRRAGNGFCLSPSALGCQLGGQLTLCVPPAPCWHLPCWKNHLGSPNTTVLRCFPSECSFKAWNRCQGAQQALPACLVSHICYITPAPPSSPLLLPGHR